MKARLTGIIPIHRARIDENQRAGPAKNDIARQLNVHKTTVYRWLQRNLEGRGLQDQHRPDRPCCATDEEDDNISDFVQHHPITLTRPRLYE